MGRVALCSNELESRAKYLQNQVIPDNYMGDYLV
jgi:hypothetical protein